MGDIVSLVERASEMVDEDDAKAMEAKLRKGSFDLEDMAKQFKMMRKMGGLGGLMGLMPGIGKLKDKVMESGVSDKTFIRLEAIISSMTLGERKNPAIIKGSRKRRIAKGSGVDVAEVNRLLKQHKQMSGMMKKMGKMDKKTLMRGGLGKFLPK
jgi:signal recognition particle subunit SRP54